jgi:hypothetical protein
LGNASQSGDGGGADGLNCGDGGNDSAASNASQSADGLNCGDGGWSDGSGSAGARNGGDGGRSGGNGGASGDASQSGDGGSADGLNCGSGGQSDDGGRADARNGGCEIGDSQSAPSHYRVTVAIREGKNRQVRRMLAAVGLRTDALKRVAIGGLALGDLAEGAWRRISRDDAMSAIFGQRTAR